MENKIDSIKKLHKTFKWKTAKGEILKLNEMIDRHIVFSMRMLYNTYLTKYGFDKIVGGIKYSVISTMKNAKQALYTILIFMFEIETNRKLEGIYNQLYMEMKLNIFEKFGILIKKQKQLSTIQFLIEDKEN